MHLYPRPTLDVDRLIAETRSNQRLGRWIEVMAETASTNDVGHEKGDEGWAIFAEHQTTGRGQHGRVWLAPPQSALLFSVTLAPPAALDGPAFSTALAAVAVTQTVRELFALPAVIKWPNDVLVDAHKIAGILVERRSATVIGIGLNASIRPDEFPTELQYPASSLETILGRPIDRTALAIDVLRRLDGLYDDAHAAGVTPLMRAWSMVCQPIGSQPIRAITRTGEISGRLLDLRPDRGATIHRATGGVEIVPPEELLRICVES